MRDIKKVIHVPDERDDIECGRVVGVTEEFHEGVYDAGCDLGELDGHNVDRLDEQLSVLRCLRGTLIQDKSQASIACLLKVSFLGLLQLLLQKQNHIFHISTGCHAEDDADRLPSNLHIGAKLDVSLPFSIIESVDKP
jgi:hypothetical protein